MVREIIEQIKRTTDDHAKTLPPDGDWEPMMFLIKDGQIGISGFPMPPNGPMREFLFETWLPNQIKPHEPDAVVFLVSSWAAEVDDEENAKIEKGEAPMPSERPDRKEIILIQGASREEEFGVAGEIKRSEGPPELDWEYFPEVEQFGGRLMTALRRGVWG